MKYISLFLSVACVLAYAENKGHYVYVAADKWDCAYYNWIPPSDCKSWLGKGDVWMGGEVYDSHGCVYAKIDGKCDAETRKNVPSCSEHPPKPYPYLKDRHCPKVIK